MPDKRQLVILYGSQTGTAQAVAERIGREAKRLHFDTEVKAMNDFQPYPNLSDVSLAAFVCATTGQGDQPDNMVKFWRYILKRAHPKDLLDGLKFGVLGLGDSGYAQFNYAAKRLNKRLAHLGAQPLLSIGLADDQHDLGPDFVVDPWIKEFWSKALEVFPLPPGLEPLPSDLLGPPRYKMVFKSDNDSNGQEVNVQDKSYGPSNPYMSELLSNDRVTARDHFQDTRLIELKIDQADQGLKYNPGDVCLVQPQNRSTDVDKFLKLMAHMGDPDRKFALIKNDDNIELPPRAVLENPDCTSLRECAYKLFDFKAIPGRYFFELLSKWTTNDLEREKFVEFTTAEGQQELYEYCNRPRRNILEVLDDFSMHTVPNIPMEYIFDLMPVIKPRSFSIASSSLDKEESHGKLQLLVAVVNYRSKLVEPRLGLCSNWLANLERGSRVLIWIKPGTLKFPTDVNVPVIMVGPGTGVAPFRSFIRQEVSQNSPRRILLIFGCRSSNKDFYFKDEWTRLAEKNSNFKLLTAFSRDQEDKIYVQHVIKANQDLVGGYVFHDTAPFYIAGNAKQMPDQVKEALMDAIASVAQDPNLDMEAFLNEMIAQKGLQMETWS